MSAADLLETIVAGTRRTVAVREAREPMRDLAARAERRAPRPGLFRAALSQPSTVNIIAECKRRSPSRGVLHPDYDAAAIATAYAGAGAAAISVLTEPTFFDGSLEDLRAVRRAVPVPLLRKDFVISEYQLFEAREAGADAVLLIVAALSPGELAGLTGRAARLELDVLVEVHNEDELARAVDAGASIVGVNNRNLRTLAVDVQVSERLINRMPSGAVSVSESGVKTGAEIRRLIACGYHAFLIGERFMTAPDPGDALRALRRDAGMETADHQVSGVEQP